MIEWLRYIIEWVHYVLRNSRDVRLGQHVDRLMYPGLRKRPNPKMARRYMAFMADPDHRQRHKETLIRAGY